MEAELEHLQALALAESAYKFSAKIQTLADEAVSNLENSQIGQKIMAKEPKFFETIRKLASTADIMNNASEAEVNAAIKQIRRMASRYNMSSSDAVRLAVETGNSKAHYGSSEVLITITDNSAHKQIMNEGWTSTLISAFMKLYDCEAFKKTSQDHKSITWTLYGIAENTALAATNFCHGFNWTAQKSMLLKKGDKNSYRQGVALGLYQLAKDEKEQEIQQTEGDQSSWSGNQLIKYREDAKTVAQQWLKDRGPKLRHARKRRGPKIRDNENYEKGREDSKRLKSLQPKTPE